MATRHESGASGRVLNGTQDHRRQSETPRQSSRPTQVPRRSLSTYLRDWTGPTNSDSMAPTGPPVGLFSVASAPSPVMSSSESLTRSEEPLAQPQPAVNGSITSSNNGFLAEASHSSRDLSQLRGSEKSHGEHTMNSRAPQRSVPLSDQTPGAMPKSTVESASLQPIPLEEIGHLDGDNIYIPKKLRREFFDIAQVNRNFGSGGRGSRSAETFADGSPRKWLIYGKVEIRVARFRYGPRHQILVAQGLPGSQWENGDVVVIGGGSPNQGGFSKWKVWRSKKNQFDEYYTVCCVHSSSAVVGYQEYSISEERGTTDPIASSTVTIPTLRDHTNRHGRITDSAASPLTLKYTAGLKKRGLGSFSYPSLLGSTGTQKRIRSEKADSDSTSTDGTTQLSPELGSSPIVQPSDAASPLAAPTTTPLTSPTNADSVGSMSGLPTILDTTWSLPSFGQEIAQIEVQDDISASTHPTFTAPPAGNNELSLPSFKKEEREVIEIEDDDAPPNEDPTFDIEKLKIVFVNSKGDVMDNDYLYESCDSIDLLFRAADVADIINSDIHKLTITVVGKKGRKELNVGRGFKEDFNRVKVLVKKLEALEIRVAKGMKKVTFD